MRKKPQKPNPPKTEDNGVKPLMAYESSANLSTSRTRTRRNAASSIHRTDAYKNIDDGLIPWKYSANYNNNSLLEIRDSVILCQKAYYNFSQFRNVIDLMTEFSSGSIYFKGGSKKSRNFFDAYLKKIGIWDIQDKFFREYYRSGNVFIYRLESEMSQEDVKKITQTFASLEESVADTTNLPTKYLFLNPADLRLTGSLNFGAYGGYYKTLSAYEKSRLINPTTEEDYDFLNSLPEESKKSLKSSKKDQSLMIPLSADKVIAVFYKKQDYEPFAVPMGYPVLMDLNFKQELKQMDMAIGRCIQQAVLLVTMGAPPDEGGINQRNLAAMQELFQNESVGRVLISDYTTKAEFVVPRVADLMDPRKYEIFDRDINLGLNNILVGGEKFSNLVSKVELFLSRLNSGREAFLNYFIKPEIKRVAKALNLKNYPTPYYDEISLGDNVAKERIYTRLYELGVLTADEIVEALESNRLPTKDQSLESQQDFVNQKEKGYYQPVIGGAKPNPSDENKSPEEMPKENGRPVDSGGEPQENPSVASEQFDFSKIKDNMLLAQELEKKVQSFLRARHSVKRLKKEQKEVCTSIANLIIANEEPKAWLDKIGDYADNPKDKNHDRVKHIYQISEEYSVDFYLASLMLASKI